MVLIWKPEASKEEIEALKQKVEAAAHQQTKGLDGKKGLDAKKHCGVLKLTEDPMAIQKRLRDEWD